MVQPRFKYWAVSPPSLPFFLPSSPSPPFPFLGADPLKPARGLVSAKPGRQTVSVHFEVKAHDVANF